ncbi:MAG: hypothetical protein IPG53_03425 [Ignavibacteriales bacterium]|nr:hypothetical protein [Ignavibacteriales bacterium]
MLTGGYLQKSGEVELNNLVEIKFLDEIACDPVKQSQVSLDLQHDVSHEARLT